MQVVAHDGAAYPVVADPRLSIGWGVYVYMAGVEIRTLVTGLTIASGAIVVTSCSAAYLDQLPVVGRAAKLLKLLCGWLVASSLQPFIKALRRSIDNGGPRDQSCYDDRFPGRGKFEGVACGHCSGRRHRGASPPLAACCRCGGCACSVLGWVVVDSGCRRRLVASRSARCRVGDGARVGRATEPVHSCEGPLGANGDRLWQATDTQALGWGGSEGVDGAAGHLTVDD